HDTSHSDEGSGSMTCHHEEKTEQHASSCSVLRGGLHSALRDCHELGLILRLLGLELFQTSGLLFGLEPGVSLQLADLLRQLHDPDREELVVGGSAEGRPGETTKNFLFSLDIAVRLFGAEGQEELPDCLFGLVCEICAPDDRV